jgi:hypothetical protein
VDDREAQLVQCVLADLRVAERTCSSGTRSSTMVDMTVKPPICPEGAKRCLRRVGKGS